MKKYNLAFEKLQISSTERIKYLNNVEKEKLNITNPGIRTVISEKTIMVPNPLFSLYQIEKWPVINITREFGSFQQIDVCKVKM